MYKHSNIPIFIPHRGCNNNCVFCNQRSITGNKCAPTVTEVKEIIDEYLGFLKDREAEIAFFGGSFTGIPIEEQTEYLICAYEYVKNKKVLGIRISTRPDYIDEEILANLKKYGVINIELGVQSMCGDVLKASKRGHTASDTYKAVNLIKSEGFGLGLQMMIGLPCDTPAKSRYTACEIVKMGADFARVYPVCVLQETELYDMYKRGEYSPLDVDTAVEIAVDVMKILESGGVSVIRIGLQETDTLGGSVAAGAYHPAMGELVKSRIIRDSLENEIINQQIKEEIVFKVPAHMLSKTVGQHRCNVLYLEKKYNVKISFQLI